MMISNGDRYQMFFVMLEGLVGCSQFVYMEERLKDPRYLL